MQNQHITNSNLTSVHQWRQQQAQMLKDNEDPTIRRTGGDMGKNAFLQLLVMQLRHQDPLDPQSDGEFAAQLAQFTALEQMENMNATLTAMQNQNSFGLVGQFVMALGREWNPSTNMMEEVEIVGIVEAVFMRDGVMYAQIGDITIPTSAIVNVFDSSGLLTSRDLLESSNMLIGREVQAHTGQNETVSGTVRRIVVEQSMLWAYLETGDGEYTRVNVAMIFDIRSDGHDWPRTDLNNRITEAQSRVSGVIAANGPSGVFEGTRWATQEAIDTFNAAIAAAQAVFADQSADRAALTAATNDLNTASAAFNPQNGTRVLMTPTLNTRITYAQNRVNGVVVANNAADVYVGTFWATQEAINTLNAAVSAAQAVAMANSNAATANGAAVDAALATLNDAIAAFTRQEGTRPHPAPAPDSDGAVG